MTVLAAIQLRDRDKNARGPIWHNCCSKRIADCLAVGVRSTVRQAVRAHWNSSTQAELVWVGGREPTIIAKRRVCRPATISKLNNDRANLLARGGPIP